MSAADLRIAAARDAAEARRHELVATLDEIKLRLAPRTIAQDAWQGAKDKGSDVADSAIGAVRQRPGIAAGVVAGAALFFARKPLLDLITGLFAEADEAESHTKSKKE